MDMFHEGSKAAYNVCPLVSDYFEALWLANVDVTSLEEPNAEGTGSSLCLWEGS